MDVTRNQTVLSTKLGGIHSTSCSSATATNITVPEDVASLYDCPVCFDYILSPILQCQNGHLHCSNCHPKLSCCPTCRAPLGKIRNFAMEKVASSVMFPCKYSTSGCAVSLLYSERREHENACEFRPYSCPFPGSSCTWEGSLEQVVPHLMKYHESIPIFEAEDILCLVPDISLPGAVDWGIIQSCFGHHFMVVLMKRETLDGHQLFFARVQLIGSRKQGENFEYRLELNGHGIRFIWEGTPRSIHEGDSSDIMNPYSLIFDTKFAEHFADEDTLGFLVSISMASDWLTLELMLTSRVLIQ